MKNIKCYAQAADGVDKGMTSKKIEKWKVSKPSSQNASSKAGQQHSFQIISFRRVGTDLLHMLKKLFSIKIG
jgi:hypothetical protein